MKAKIALAVCLTIIFMVVFVLLHPVVDMETSKIVAAQMNDTEADTLTMNYALKGKAWLDFVFPGIWILGMFLIFKPKSTKKD